MSNSEYKGRPWSYGIIAAIGIFMLGTISMVYIFVSQDIQVLYPDYYERTLNYDGVQERLSAGLNDENKIHYQLNSSKDSLILQFLGSEKVEGTIAFIKPNNASSDKKYTFNGLADQSIRVAISDLEKGLWNVEMEWKKANVDILTRFRLTL